VVCGDGGECRCRVFGHRGRRDGVVQVGGQEMARLRSITRDLGGWDWNGMRDDCVALLLLHCVAFYTRPRH